jgi:hypothetical protein
VATFWESFRLDPRQSENASMRASDADREIVRVALAEAYADGRLTREEYDERLGTLYASRTIGELPALVTDLVPASDSPSVPVPSPDADLRARGARKWRRDVEEAFTAFFIPNLICVVIWVASARGFFWPAFPMVFLGINLIRTVIQRESVIDREVRRLEKLEARRLEKQAAKDAPPDS